FAKCQPLDRGERVLDRFLEAHGDSLVELVAAFEVAEDPLVALPFGSVERRARRAPEAAHAPPGLCRRLEPTLPRVHGRKPGEAEGDLQLVLQLEPDLEAL